MLKYQVTNYTIYLTLKVLMILLRFISISEYEGSIILILEKDTGSNQ